MEDDLDKLARILKKEPDFNVVREKLEIARRATTDHVLKELGWTRTEYYNKMKERNLAARARMEMKNDGQTSQS